MQDISEKKFTVREVLDAAHQVMSEDEDHLASDELVRKTFVKLESKSNPEYIEYLRLKALFK